MNINIQDDAVFIGAISLIIFAWLIKRYNKKSVRKANEDAPI